ncbi:MAG: hypothetical protein ILO10_03765 [Kiritimatiellae bacterium]|nr:hypothetical protein [Kiritimatiellia bacterium]
MPRNLHPLRRRTFRHSPAYCRKIEAREAAEAAYLSHLLSRGPGQDLATAVAEVIVVGAVGITWWTIRKVIGIPVGIVQSRLARRRREAMTRELAGRGIPTPEALERRWHRSKRKKLREALRLGAMLMQIADTTSHALVKGKDGLVTGRGGGLKAWLKTYCPSIPYSTATRYKRLAEQLLHFLSIQGERAGAAMEWVLPEEGGRVCGTSRSQEECELDRLREVVGRLMEFYPSQRGLAKVLKRELERGEAEA